MFKIFGKSSITQKADHGQPRTSSNILDFQKIRAPLYKLPTKLLKICFHQKDMSCISIDSCNYNICKIF